MNEKLALLEDWGCDISGALPRFLQDEDFMLDCIKQVAADPSFERLSSALACGDVKEAFEAAHMLKGISANTGLTPIYELAVKLVEPLRGGNAEGLEPLCLQLNAARNQLKDLLAE